MRPLPLYLKCSTAALRNQQLWMINVLSKIFRQKILIFSLLEFLFHFPNQTIDEGSDVTLICNATGYPQPIIRWIRAGGAPLPFGDSYYSVRPLKDILITILNLFSAPLMVRFIHCLGENFLCVRLAKSLHQWIKRTMWNYEGNLKVAFNLKMICSNDSL